MTLLSNLRTDTESKVYYEFDKNDDIDEEDPDDDLDIWRTQLSPEKDYDFNPCTLWMSWLREDFSLWICSYFWSESSRIGLSFESSLIYFYK